MQDQIPKVQGRYGQFTVKKFGKNFYYGEKKVC